jgi:uncharacterized protein
MLRDAASRDWPEILALNEEWVRYLSPMDGARLAKLAGASCYFRVIEHERKVAAFLLAFRKGAAYDGTIFQIFDKQTDDFIYVDRVVVALLHRGKGMADDLYDDVVAFAQASGAGRLVCEVNLLPPNESSLRFHDRRGFRAIGRLSLKGEKTVSLLEYVARAA